MLLRSNTMVFRSLLLVLSLSFLQLAYAHSGRTNSEGCHAGSKPYHCHGSALTTSKSSTRYNRRDYGSWADIDQDCKSTRHEVLEEFSLGPVKYSSDGCKVISGRWYGVFSGKYFSKASEMDIDHVFPVSLADKLGGRNWPRELKREFYNDPVNLLPVSSRLNRAKGAEDPTDWMPPNTGFRCEYVTRFLRVGLKYSLVHGEYRTEIERLRHTVCG